MSSIKLNSKVILSGNSAAVRLKSSLLEAVGLSIGHPIQISILNNGIFISPLKYRPSVNIDELIARITPENCHGETFVVAPVGTETAEL